MSGIFIWLSARRLVSDDGALLTAAVYLYLPYGVFASRSFQPEPLMMLLFAGFFWALVRWDAAKQNEENTWGWAITTGLFGGAAIFIKMTIVFLVFGALAGAFLKLRALKKTFSDLQLWVATTLTLIPTAAYLVYGIFIDGFLSQQVNGRFFPDMLLQPSFYLRWGLKLEFVVGYGILSLTILGIFLFPDKNRRIILGLLAGYLAFGLYFNYHFSTHDYYQIPFILIASLAIAPLADAIKSALQTHYLQKLIPQIVLTIGLATAILGSAWHTRSDLLATDYRPLAEVYADIGDTLRNEGKIIALSEDYGNRLDYWGWFYAANFPSMGDLWYHEKRGSDKNIDNLIKKYINDYDYFLVTDFDEWALQDDLRAYLTENYSLLLKMTII
jgi:4-amino-4-deoxy-L-arabinose transferase-like glycosyltransferase